MTDTALDIEQLNRKRVALHPGQTAIFQTDARFRALIAGTGGGKTWTGPWWLANEIAKNPQGLFGVGAPTHKMLERQTVRELVNAFKGTSLEGEYKSTRGEYLLPTGGMIYLCSMQDPNLVEGGQYNAWWLDEAGQMAVWAWVVIQARLGFHEGNLLLTTTPYNLGWLYRDIYKPAQDGDTDYFVSQFPSTWNPQYPHREFERAKRTMDERTFAMRYCGEFRKMSGLVWPGLADWVCPQDETDAALQAAQDAPQSVQWVGGIDWGYNNPFVALSGFLDSDDVLWLTTERYVAETLLKDHASSLDQQSIYYADPSGKQQIEEMIALGLTVYKADNDVTMGIERVTNRGKTGRLKISPACRNLINEAESYRYKEETDKPIKSDDHAPDALRYLISGIDQFATPEIVSVNDTEPNYAESEQDALFSDDSRIWQECV